MCRNLRLRAANGIEQQTENDEDLEKAMEEFLKKQAEAESGVHLASLSCIDCSMHHSSVAVSESSHSLHALCGVMMCGTVTCSTPFSCILPAAAGSLLAQPAEPVVEVVGSEAVTEQVSSTNVP